VTRSAETPRRGDIVAVRTPDGLRFEVVKGTPEDQELEVLALAIDRMAAWDRGQRLGPWVTTSRPGIGVRAYQPGSRWSASLRATWGSQP
jgi:hypothetical protein